MKWPISRGFIALGGRAPRLYFITQAETAPPTFVVIASHPDSVHFSYQRFVANQLRKRFGFEGVPIRVLYKEKRRSARKRPEGADGTEA
jgi:GTP-binding protein